MADEWTQGGTVFYRISDTGYDTQNVKDTTLHSAFGDLSDGNAPILFTEAGIDSKLSLLEFVVQPRPTYGDSQASMVGFDLNLVTRQAPSFGYNSDNQASGFDDSQGYKALPTTSIYKMKDKFQIQYEGNVAPVNSAHQTLDYGVQNNVAWERADMAAFISYADYDASLFEYTEDFSGTSDIGDKLYKFTRSGRVYAGTKKYIEPDIALEKMDGYINKGKEYLQDEEFRMMEMMGFYGSTSRETGSPVIFIEPESGDMSETSPDLWVPAHKVGHKQGFWDHPSQTGQVAQNAPSAPVAPTYMALHTSKEIQGHYSNAATNMRFGKEGVSAGKPYEVARMPFTAKSGVQYPGGTDLRFVQRGAGTNISATGKVTGTAGWLGKRGTFGRYAIAGARGISKRIPIIGTLIAGVTSWYGAAQRANALQEAHETGDFSALNRPYAEPKWKHDDIKDNIQLDDAWVELTVDELDETACTTTSCWWDKIKEVRDFAKLATATGQSTAVAYDSTDDETVTSTVGSGQAYGSQSPMLAKSSINFSNLNSLNGGSMRMSCYHDIDISSHPNRQVDYDFQGTHTPMQQDIYVSKYDLPAPAHIYQTGNNWSQANQEPPYKYEISWTQYIEEMAQDYSIGKSTSGGTTVQQHYQYFRRGMAVTFSNQKPLDNECFLDYMKRHGVTTDGTAWTKDIMGFIIHNSNDPTGSANNASDSAVEIIPIAHVQAADADGTADDGAIVVPIRKSATFTDEIYPLNGSSIVIPTSQWLRFKLSTDVHGAEGMSERHRGRFYLSISHESGELLDEQKEDGDWEGPICLCSPKDVLSKADSDLDTPINLQSWMRHMTIWVCNRANASGGGYNAKGDGRTTHTNGQNDIFYHDSLSSGSLATTLNLVENEKLEPTALTPYFLAKTTVFFDEFKIKNAQPRLINMSVNNRSPLRSVTSQPMNKFARNVVLPAYHPRWSDSRPGNNTKDTGYDVSPTVLALGFKTTTNLVSSDGSPKFLLFNDFKSTGSEASPVPFADSEMKAGFQDDSANKLGDWIDSYSQITKDSGLDVSSGLNNTTDPVTFTASSSAATVFDVGDLIKVDSEYMEVTGVSGTSITVARNIANGGSIASHGAVSIYHAGVSLFDKLDIGSAASNDIITSAAEGDAYDKNQSSGHRAYVEGFSQKGFLQFENSFTNWTRRECIYASTRITRLGLKGQEDLSQTIGQNQAVITIADTQAIQFEAGLENEGGEQYILYKYGTDSTPATMFDQSTGTAAIVNIVGEKDNTIAIRRDTSTNWGGSSTKAGVYLDNLLTSSNLPRLFLCPYRYWVCINIDAMDEIDYSQGITDQPYHERGYGSILPVADPSSGYDLGVTYNESKFYVGSDDKTQYANWRSFDITEGTDAPYELNTDFGNGVWDSETGMGGSVTTFKPQFGVNRIGLDNLMMTGPKEGDIMSLVLSPTANNTVGNRAMYYSGEASASLNGVSAKEVPKIIPQLATKYFDPSPMNPSLNVVPHEDNPLFPEFQFEVSDSDLWYGYLILDNKDIKNKYHGITGYAPYNENVDTQPWLGVQSSIRGGDDNPQYKVYHNEKSIGKSLISDTSLKMSYATTNGTYNGTSSGGESTMEGLGGRALDTRDNRGSTNHGYSASLDSSALYPGSGYIIGAGFSLVIHTISEKSASDGTLFELDGSSGNSPIKISTSSSKVVARVYGGNGGNSDYTEITSLTSLPEDGDTPTCIILTCDPDLVDANMKLFINGKLEAQSGPLQSTQTATSWGYGDGVYTGVQPVWEVGAAEGIYEEVILYSHVIYPISLTTGSGADTIIVDKPLEEIAESTSGMSEVYNARLCVFDYHNLRGDVCGMSPQVSFTKTAFKLDGT